MKKNIKKISQNVLTNRAFGVIMNTEIEREVITMMNEMIFKTLINGYEEVAFTGNYIFGYTDRHNVYVSFATSEILPFVTCLDKDSSKRTGGYSLRFKPTKAQKEVLKMEKSFVLCSEAYFEGLVKESKYNRGEIFEKLITEYFGQVWEKDNVPFTQAGDIEVDGVAYQIKYQKATFCTESSLANLRK